MSLAQQAFEQGKEDGANGYKGPDQADIADLILQVPVEVDEDGFPTEATRQAEKAIEDAYAKGYGEAKKNYEILQPVHLGSGQLGESRKKALEQLAAEADCFWGGKPSIGRWLVKVADQKIAEQINL